MKAWDYEGVYVFAEDGSGHLGTYCNQDAKRRGYDLEAENLSPIFATDEGDFYDSCEDCGYVFSYINLTEEGERWLEEAKEEELARVAGMTTGQRIRWFVGELMEKDWLFGGHYGAYNAQTMASHGRIDEAFEMLRNT